MEKEAFLHQFESSLANNDKRLFAKTIYDLPADVIVGFTKEEFSRIVYISHQFSSQKMDRLVNTLGNKGQFFLKRASNEIDKINSCLLSKFYYSLFISLCGNNKERLKSALGNNAGVCLMLAEMGIDSRENLETAIRLCGDAMEIFPITSGYYTAALVNGYTAIQILSKMGIDSRENLETTIRFYMNVKGNFPKKSTSYADVLIKEGDARIKLAEMGIDSKENLETSIHLYDNARKNFPEKSINYADTLMKEGNTRIKLAEMGIDSINNLETAIRLYMEGREIFPKTSTEYVRLLFNEGTARHALAENGIDSKENLETAVRIFGDAREYFPKTSVDYAFSLINEGNARQILAEMGIDNRENLETAVHLYGEARKIVTKTSTEYAHSLMSEGSARQRLADMGIDSKENLETAIRFYIDSREIFPKTSSEYASSLTNEGNARLKLADMGIDSRENLEASVRLSCDARRIFPKTSASYAGALMNEGNARQILAEMGIDSRKNLETSIRFYKEARETFPKTSIDYARSLVAEGSARQTLALTGTNIKENLETVITLCCDSRNILSPISIDYAHALTNEGSARQTLALMGIDSKENLETAISLYGDAREIFTKTSASYALALMNEGNARKTLSEMGINSKDNFEKSKELYLQSISILEELGDGWAYSISLLNFNNLLKENFYKTGEKKYLEEWEKSLGDIEEKIKDRDIRYKELLLARIYEIRASLFEFEEDIGVSNAALEYYKAYEISHNVFYKFMKDFCQARIVKPSIFCKLVSDWKEIEKEGIFLDYYDYAVFECHLENALKSTINEEDELKLAVEKLREIRDRTQIKIIKDRVSAYIHLLQALIDCFNKDSYREAAENVKEGCKIFREYGDKQGQQMCEIFHNAVVRERDPDAWQEIIRNREFSSNFYSLLCEYSDRKRANLGFYRFDQVHEMLGAVSKDIEQVKDISTRTESKVDEIKSDLEDIKDKIDYVTISLKPGIKEEVEISVGAEYLGTGAKHIITISLQDISYSELKEDLEKIAGNRINRLSDIPPKLANTIKAYLLRHGKENILEKLA